MHRIFSVLLLFAGLLLPCAVWAQVPAPDGALHIADLGRCPLSDGGAIENCRVGYRTWGKLNAARTNAVVVPSWLNGRSEDLASLFGTGSGALVDTSRFFVVAMDAFGDGVSSSPSNSRNQHGVGFPVFNMEDMVRAQYRVLHDVLGVEKLHAAVGLSMGGEQVFAWAVLYPHYLERAVPIVGSPQVTPFDLLSKTIVIDAIRADPGYDDGRYTAEPKLALANEIGFQMVSAPPFRNAQTSRTAFPQWLAEIRAPQRQDANDRVWQAEAILHHDVLHGRTVEVAARATAPVRFLVVVAAQDRMVTPAPALRWAAALGAPTYVSPGACAHLIMSCDAENVAMRVRAFLSK